MSSSNRMLTFQLVALVWSYLVSSLALAYSTGGQTSSSSSRPVVHHPIDLQEIRVTRRTPTTKQFPTQEEAASMARGRYNLGIGKNPPLIKKGQAGHDSSSLPSMLPTTSFQDDHMISDQHHHADHASTTRFLVEHAAAREYPSPLQAASAVLQLPTPLPPPQQQHQQKRIMPKVQHERRVKDVLHIDHPSEDVGTFTPIAEGGANNVMKPSSSSPLLPLIRASSKVQLDVNTVWVEMMLHSEHMKSVSMVPSAVV